MSALSDQLDDAVSDAQQAVIDAANVGPYTPDLQAKIDAITAELQSIENNMLLATQAAIIAALSGNNDKLKQLNTDIDAYATGIDHISVTIKKISDTVGIVVTVLGAVISAGVL